MHGGVARTDRKQEKEETNRTLANDEHKKWGDSSAGGKR